MTFGEQFLIMATYGQAARAPASADLMLALAAGTAVAEEVMWGVLAWRPEGPALDQLVGRLQAGLVLPPDRCSRLAMRLANSPRLQAWVDALKPNHGPAVRDAVLAMAPKAAW